MCYIISKSTCCSEKCFRQKLFDSEGKEDRNIDRILNTSAKVMCENYLEFF